MRIGHLLDSQVRDLKAAVLASGLGEDLDWQMGDGRWSGFYGETLPTLVYTPDDLYFAFEYHEPFSDQYGLTYDPGGHQVLFIQTSKPRLSTEGNLPGTT